MKILVTGASGNVGNYLVKALLKMDETIVAAGTNIKRLEKTFDHRVECVEFDFTKTKTFDGALKGVD